MNINNDCIINIIKYLNSASIYSYICTNKIAGQSLENIQQLRVDIDPDLLKYIHLYTNLKCIKLNINVCDYLFMNRFCLLHFQKLKKLNIYNNNWINLVEDNYNYKYFISSRNLKQFILNNNQLEHISIENSYVLSDFVILFIINTCVNLKSFRVHNCNNLTELSRSKLKMFTEQ